MAKGRTSDAEMLALLRAQSAAPSGDGAPGRRPMKLNPAPQSSRRSLEEMFAEDDDEVAVPILNGDVVTEAAPDALAAKSGALFLSMKLLQRHQWNARVHRSSARIQQIAAEMANQGQDSPILVTADPSHPGRYFIVDGETRYLSAEYLGWSEIWARVIDVDPNDPLGFHKVSFSKTNNTASISLVDQGLRFAELVEIGAAKVEDIASLYGVDRSQISRMMSYARFPKEVRAYMHEHAARFPYSIAAALVPLVGGDYDEELLLAYCRRVVSEELSRREINAYVKKAIAPEAQRPARRTVAISRSLKTPHGLVGSFKTYESGAVEFKLTGAHGLSDEAYGNLLQALTDAADTVVGASAPGSGAGSRQGAVAGKTSRSKATEG